MAKQPISAPPRQRRHSKSVECQPAGWHAKVSKARDVAGQNEIEGIVEAEGEKDAQGEEQDWGFEIRNWRFDIGYCDGGKGQASDANVGDVFDVLGRHGLKAGQQGARQVERRKGKGNSLLEQQPSSPHRETRKLPGGDQLHRRQRHPQPRRGRQQRRPARQRAPLTMTNRPPQHRAQTVNRHSNQRDKGRLRVPGQQHQTYHDHKSDEGNFGIGDWGLEIRDFVPQEQHQR